MSEHTKKELKRSRRRSYFIKNGQRKYRFFYIARSVIAKKGSQAVSFITGSATCYDGSGQPAMFTIISVFSGLEDLNKDFISNLHADLP